MIEAVPENIDLKLETFAQLDRPLPARGVLATNTSALSVTEIAAAAERPERGAGHALLQPGAA